VTKRDRFGREPYLRKTGDRGGARDQRSRRKAGTFARARPAMGTDGGTPIGAP